MPGEREATAEEVAKYERMGREHMAGSMGEGQESTEKYDDDPALKGDQDELPDALQKGIIQAKEGVSLSEENIDEIVESLVVDMMPVKRGWAGTPESEMQFNEKLAAAMAQSDKFKEEKEELLKVGKELTESIEKHQHVNSKLKEVVDALKERLDEVNLNNARLLYTNRVLKESSLNERQKETIVEALSNAGSVNEAKVIFETLQSTVGSSFKKNPKSLNEAVSRPSTILPRSKSQSNQSDSFSNRMKLLAGIKN
jgi:glutamyl/glutaminyl-tRNA synthetase